MLKLKLQYFGHLMQRADSLEKTLMLGKIEGRRRRGRQRMRWLDGISDSVDEFEQTPGDGEGQGSLVCCSPWSNKDSDTTEWLINNNNIQKYNWLFYVNFVSMTLLNSRIFEAFPFVLPFLDFLFPYPVTLAAPNSDLLTPQPKTVAFCLDFICNDRGLTVPGKEKLDKCGPHSVWFLSFMRCSKNPYTCSIYYLLKAIYYYI